MVQEGIGAETDFRDVGRGHGHAAADRQEAEPAGKEQHARGSQAQTHPFARKEANHAVIDPCHHPGREHEQEHLAHRLPRADAGQRPLRIGEVDQDRGVDAETPVAVERKIDGEDGRREERHDEEVAPEHAAPHPVGQRHPQRREGREQRQRRDIARHGHVEREAVPQHEQPLRQRGLGGLRSVKEQEYGLLQRHQERRGRKYGKEEQQSSLHFGSLLCNRYSRRLRAGGEVRQHPRITCDVGSGAFGFGPETRRHHCGQGLRQRTRIICDVGSGAVVFSPGLRSALRSAQRKQPFFNTAPAHRDTRRSARPRAARKTALRGLPPRTCVRTQAAGPHSPDRQIFSP